MWPFKGRTQGASQFIYTRPFTEETRCVFSCFLQTYLFTEVLMFPCESLARGSSSQGHTQIKWRTHARTHTHTRLLSGSFWLAVVVWLLRPRKGGHNERRKRYLERTGRDLFIKKWFWCSIKTKKGPSSKAIFHSKIRLLLVFFVPCIYSHISCKISCEPIYWPHTRPTDC